MKILVACEESQIVTKELRKLGHEAYSCDLIECSGGHPEWHIQKDAIQTAYDKSYKWDMMIAHPPCTYLTTTGNRWFKEEYKERFPNRHKQRDDAIEFFMKFVNAPIDKIAIENPISIMSSKYRKPNQYIQPYEFGHCNRKKTCLWLKNLPNLTPTKIVEPKLYYFNHKGSRWSMDYEYIRNSGKTQEERSKNRSKTFLGIAKAMAQQWT